MNRLLTPLLTLLCLMQAFSTIAQDKLWIRQDSLQRKIATLPDGKPKLDLYHELLYEYQLGYTEEALKYVEPALALSEKLNYKKAHTNIACGRIYWKLGNFDLALKYHFKALRQFEADGDDDGVAIALTSIGQAYGDGGNYPQALDYFSKAAKIRLKLNDQSGLASTYNLIAWVYNRQGISVKSAEYDIKALKIYEDAEDELGVSVTSSNLARLMFELGKSREAISYILPAIEIQKNYSDYANLSATYRLLSNAYADLKDFKQASKYADLSYSTASTIGDKIQMGDIKAEIAALDLLKGDYLNAIHNYKSAITLYRAVNAEHLLASIYSKLSVCYLRIDDKALAKKALDSAAYFSSNIDSPLLFNEFIYSKQLYDSATGSWKSAYFNYYDYIQLRDSLFNDGNTKKLMQTQLQYEYDKKEAAAIAEQEKKDIQSRNQRNMILIGGFIFLLLSAGLWSRLHFIRKATAIIKKEKARSEELLLNILPEEVAQELKEKGHADAKHFDEVTVLFTDFKNFTSMSEVLTAQELVNEINFCYSAFDQIISKYNIEKIKTIGDSYMCAGGLPVASKTNAVDTVMAALEMRDFIVSEKRRRQEEGKSTFEIRIGCHTGPVVAGIVGIKKFAYDIWGDTVNIASRMESAGESDKVNISESTYELVKGHFKCSHRGKVAAKNKGEIDMYFVERLDAE